MANSLLKQNTIRNYAPDFSNIKSEDFKEAFELAMEKARHNVAAIADNQQAPTFENTMVALEAASEELEDISSVFFNLASVNTDDIIESLEGELSAAYTAFNNEITFNAKLFQRVKILYAQKDALGLNAEQMTLLENSYKSFVRSGADLSPEQQERMNDVGQRLAKLGADFSKNMRDYKKDFQLWIDDVADLDGLPDWYIEEAAANAKAKGQDGKWLVTLDYPSYIPFMTFAKNRDLREKLWYADGKTANEPPYDNKPVVLEMLKLRQEKAHLLGYETYAHYVLDERMAKTPDTVFNFLNELKDEVFEAGKKEVAAVAAMAKKDGVADMKPWDFGFYSEKLKQETLGFSDEDLRPYYKLENVLDGCFDHAAQLLGLRFAENKTYPTYHEDVRAFDVFDKETDAFIGTLYADFFPRENKQSGAWETSYRKQGLYKDSVERPVVAISCNFTKPGQNRPSLLTHNEVETLFHEIGHALHDLVSECEYRSVSGTSVKWDFVELPSQIMENWTYQRETLDKMARHFETGERMPDELFQKLQDSSKFQKAYWRMRQIQFSLLDMRLHTVDANSIDDLIKAEQDMTKDTALFPHSGFSKAASFGHLFGGGYAAGYYSYQWAELLDADAFEKFLENGLYDTASGKALRKLLAQGGSRDPNVIYREFRGRDADPKAILRRDGLAQKKTNNGGVGSGNNQRAIRFKPS